jgi:phosphatidylserine/phosphatidylglycerophosphate/cardiolipin synthase-like enzyme
MLDRFDAWVGSRIEHAIVSHHRRRLRRVRNGALDGPAGGWAAGLTPPRSGNAVDVLVDGVEAFTAFAEAIDRAQTSIWLAGWFFSPELRLRREDERTLAELLAEAAERVDVRVLAWAGAPLPVFHPDRSEARGMRDALVGRSRVVCALDGHERPLHCHHEKLMIVDGDVAFVGGIDLTSFHGDRLDSSDHPARGELGWHDAAARLRGPAVADVAAHFRLRWHAVTGERLAEPAAPAAAGDVELQVVRTVPERIYDELPNGDFSILDSYLRAFRSARRLIYVENQFLWSPEVVDVLAAKLRRPPDDRFRLLVVLPINPNNGRDDTRGQLGLLAAADANARRFLACALYQRGEGARPIYVHAKIAIVDDEWLTIGSANLNEHSLFNDTEVNLAARNPALARATRLRLWGEHLERDRSELEGDPTDVVDELWTPVAREQLARLRAHDPLTHRLLALPHVSRRTNALRGPIDALIVDG